MAFAIPVQVLYQRAWPSRDVSCESYLYQWNDEFDMAVKLKIKN